VDALRDELYVDLVTLMQRDPSLAPSAVELIFVARNIERIADHAAKIAGDVVFLVKGVDIRHDIRAADAS
jgi:phosphate transport system protein